MRRGGCWGNNSPRIMKLKYLGPFLKTRLNQNLPSSILSCLGLSLTVFGVQYIVTYFYQCNIHIFVIILLTINDCNKNKLTTVNVSNNTNKIGI